ncbi:unannotated protein [freshwater metagenome]|uniref:Unannotated protein n=1 Tax=freshwater metagenome TaxID=449393 RepID=A0A6J6I965_9ZZZZ
MDGSKWVSVGNHGGVYARAHALGSVCRDDPLTNREQFHDVTGLPGGADLVESDFGDSFAIDEVDRHVGVEGKRCENRRLLRCVVSFDVCAAVVFGVSKLFRHGERVLH